MNVILMRPEHPVLVGQALVGKIVVCPLIAPLLRFAAQVSVALGRRAAPGKSGRPRKVVEPESSNLSLT